MNKIEFLKERIATYTACIARCEKTQANLALYLESNSMEQVEYNARLEHSKGMIEMYKEKLGRVQRELTRLTRPTTTCSKCGQAAFGAVQVRDEDGILLAVKYQHEMLPESGYVWTCTQVMEHQPVYTAAGSVKKEMAKRPYAFKSRDASHYNDLHGNKVGV